MVNFSRLALIVNRLLFLFICLFILSLPFPHYHIIPDVGTLLNPVFQPILKWTATSIWNIPEVQDLSITSDTKGLYINALNLFIISILISIFWSLTLRSAKGKGPLSYWLQVITRYYLALQLFIYGFSKIFKWQFYLPEPNTLFTPLGQITPDLLFWSTVGISRSYSIFSGIIEVIPAILLLFRPTKFFGALLAFGVLVNVVVLNFSYDISVKFYSSFLLFLSLVLILFDHQKWAFLITGKTFQEDQGYIPPLIKVAHPIYFLTKGMIILLIVLDPLSLYFQTNNLNDDAAPRPPLHGAYEVVHFIQNQDTIPPILTDSVRWRRIFIHRRQYFIIQFMDDHMEDFPLELDTTERRLLLGDQPDAEIGFFYQESTGNLFFLEGKFNQQEYQILLKKIDWRALPIFD